MSFFAEINTHQFPSYSGSDRENIWLDDWSDYNELAKYKPEPFFCFQRTIIFTFSCQKGEHITLRNSIECKGKFVFSD